MAWFREPADLSDKASWGLHGSTLNGNECASCMAVGAMALVAAALLKVTPESWVDRVNPTKYLDEDNSQQ